jgi:hypothetical protein
MADDSSTNTDTANSSINQPTKASLDKFSKEEVQFLKDRLPEYIAANNEGPSKKGDKGDWVSQNIIPAFKDCFGYSADVSDGPSMDSLVKVHLVSFACATAINHRAYRK